METLDQLLTDPAATQYAKARFADAQARHGATARTAARAWYRIDNKTDDGDEPATVWLYDFIDPYADEYWGGVAAKDFARDLAAIDANEIVVRVNSPGGDVYDALAITNSLRQHPAKIIVQIDGLAASAASYIAMAGDDVIIARNAEIMIHDAIGGAVGNANDLKIYAGWLDRISNNIAEIYAERAGGTAAEWREAMRAETWYSAAQAVDAGLADKVAEPVNTDDADSGGEHARAEAVNALRSARPAAQTAHPYIPAATAVGTTGKEAPVATLKEGLVERLGLDADASDDAILEAVDALIAKANDNDGADNTVADVAQITDLAHRNGLQVVDIAKFEDLQRQAAEGAQARAAQVATARAQVVDAAVDKGKIAPARRDHFLALMDADEDGTTSLLNQLPDELAVPLTEIGHGVAENTADELGWFDQPATKEA